MPKKVFLWALFIIILAAAGSVFFLKKVDAVSFLQKPYTQMFLPTWRSFKKIADLPYVFYQLTSDTLPAYEIIISPLDIQTLDRSLPKDPIKGRLTDEYKTQVKASFKAGEYTARVDLRYRGWVPNHWNATKKSYLIDFPGETPFGGINELNLIIPEDRSYAIEALNMYRAKKLGLFAPEPWFVNLKVNGKASGVYLAIPHWDKDFLERNGKPERANIFGTKDLPSKDLKEISFYDPETISLWKDYTKNAENNPEDFRALEEFLTLIQTAPNQTFEKVLPIILDMESFYSWLIVNALASSNHQSDQGNIILLRDSSTGRFQPIPWDVGIKKPGPISLDSNPLIGRVLSIKSFREEFLNRLENYATNQANLEDDLKFYDQVIDQIKTPLLKDSAKLPLNFQVLSDLKTDRELIVKNFAALENVFAEKTSENLLKGSFTVKSEPSPSLSSFLTDASAKTASFLNRHPSFYVIDGDTVGIGPGTYTFLNTIILPQNVDLEIKPGTKLFFGDGVSLLVFNKIIARGNKSSPIKVARASTNPWGSILVLGENKETSEFQTAHISGGSGFNKYGIIATGMLAIHGGDATISFSTFENSSDDDAINIKNGEVLIKNSVFLNTFSDAIDLDITTGQVADNTFKNIGREIGGDAIDLSFSRVEILKNEIDGCSDKGISVGENSHPFIRENIIKNCDIGISVKDLSEALIQNTSLIKNNLAVEVKQKKPLFGGGKATVSGLTLEGNKADFAVDEFSILEK